MGPEAHRARHDVLLKEIVSLNAVAQVARWLERVDPPRSGRATPYGAVVRALAWHLRIGGPGGGGGPPRVCWGPEGDERALVRRLAGGGAPPTPRREGPPGQASPEHHRH